MSANILASSAEPEGSKRSSKPSLAFSLSSAKSRFLSSEYSYCAVLSCSRSRSTAGATSSVLAQSRFDIAYTLSFFLAVIRKRAPADEQSYAHA